MVGDVDGEVVVLHSRRQSPGPAFTSSLPSAGLALREGCTDKARAEDAGE